MSHQYNWKHVVPVVWSDDEDDDGIADDDGAMDLRKKFQGNWAKKCKKNADMQPDEVELLKNRKAEIEEELINTRLELANAKKTYKFLKNDIKLVEVALKMEKMSCLCSASGSDPMASSSRRFFPVGHSHSDEFMLTYFREKQTVVGQYGMLEHFTDAKKFLKANPDLVCDGTVNFLFAWYIRLLIEKKHDLLHRFARQFIYLRIIIEYYRTPDCDMKVNAVDAVSGKLLENILLFNVCIEEFMDLMKMILGKSKEILATLGLDYTCFNMLPDYIKCFVLYRQFAGDFQSFEHYIATNVPA